METIINKLQDKRNNNDNHLTGYEAKMGDFSYVSFGDLKDDVMKKMAQGYFLGYLWIPGTCVSFTTCTIPPILPS